MNKFLLPRLQQFPDNFPCQYERRDYMGNYTGEHVYCQFYEICKQADSWQDLEQLEVE